jgi:hypothetical protein
MLIGCDPCVLCYVEVLSASVVFGWGSTLCYGARLRRANLHLGDTADDVSYGLLWRRFLGDVAPVTPFTNFNTHAGGG